jgi:hypothetical protein
MTELLFQNVIPIPLKGSRPYIHSTDLWNELARTLSASLGDEGTLKVNIRALSKASVTLVPQTKKADHVVIGDVTHTASKTRLLLIEAAQSATGHVPDHDTALSDQIFLNDGVACVPHTITASPVEGLVAGYKFLLTDMFPDVSKWLALCVDLPLPLHAPATGTLYIRHKSDIGGKTFFASIFDETDTKLGQLTFMGLDQKTYSDMEADL